MRRLLFTVASVLFGGAGAFAQVPPPIPPNADANRIQSYTFGSSTSQVGVGFPVYGDCTDLLIIIAGVTAPYLPGGLWDCASTSGTPLSLLPLPITDMVVNFTPPLTTGALTITGAWHARNLTVPTAPGITRREYQQTVGALIAGQRELSGNLTTSLSFQSPSFGGTANAANIAFVGSLTNKAGSFSLVDLYTAPPANGFFTAGGGAEFKKADITGSSSAASDRAATFLRMTSTGDASTAETNLVLNTSVVTGFSKPWTISTAFASGAFTAANGNVYQETVSSCTTASSGTGPSGTGTAIADNTCSWNYKTPDALSYRAGIYNATVLSGAPGSSWGFVNNLLINASTTLPTFIAAAEFDFGNNSANCVVGTKNCYNLFLAGTTAFPITAALALSQSTGATAFGAHFGILLNGNKVAQDADISDNSAGGVGLDFGGLGAQSHSIASIRDASTSPIGISLLGSYSTAAIGVPSAAKICFSGSAQCFAYNATPGAVQPPSGSGHIIVPNCNASILASNTTYFCGDTSNGTENLTQIIMPRAGTLRNLYTSQNIAPGGTQTTIYTVRKNAASQSITCTVTGAATSCNDTTNSFNVVAGDKIAVQAVNSLTATSTIPILGIEID